MKKNKPTIYEPKEDELFLIPKNYKSKYESKIEYL